MVNCVLLDVQAVVSHVAANGLIITCRSNHNEYNKLKCTNMAFQILHSTFLLQFNLSALYRH